MDNGEEKSVTSPCMGRLALSRATRSQTSGHLRKRCKAVFGMPKPTWAGTC